MIKTETFFLGFQHVTFKSGSLAIRVSQPTLVGSRSDLARINRGWISRFVRSGRIFRDDDDGGRRGDCNDDESAFVRLWHHSHHHHHFLLLLCCPQSSRWWSKSPRKSFPLFGDDGFREWCRCRCFCWRNSIISPRRKTRLSVVSPAL